MRIKISGVPLGTSSWVEINSNVPFQIQAAIMGVFVEFQKSGYAFAIENSDGEDTRRDQNES
jgi:hypothetical protein